MLSGLLVATPAHAVSASVTSPDGGAFGRVYIAASEAYTLVVDDKSCDARGATLHYKASIVWRTLSDSSCHGGDVVAGPFMSTNRIDFYVCNTNTRTGYKSCSSTKTLRI